MTERERRDKAIADYKAHRDSKYGMTDDVNEPDLSDKETLDHLMQGMTDVCAMLEEQSKILLDIGNRLARIERLMKDRP